MLGTYLSAGQAGSQKNQRRTWLGTVEVWLYNPRVQLFITSNEEKKHNTRRMIREQNKFPVYIATLSIDKIFRHVFLFFLGFFARPFLDLYAASIYK
jgi:hypothetical protein